MKLQEWRAKRQQGTEITLDSGLVVTCKKADLIDLVAQGTIPTPLLGLVEDFANSQGGVFKLHMPDLPQISELINCVVKAVVVAPAVAEEPSDTHVGINELTFSERMQIFSWANRSAAQLAPFPAESAGTLPAA